MTDDKLRQICKELKCFQGIEYAEIAGYLEVKRNSFYNWRKGYYNFSEARKARLQEVIAFLKEA